MSGCLNNIGFIILLAAGYLSLDGKTTPLLRQIHLLVLSYNFSTVSDEMLSSEKTY